MTRTPRPLTALALIVLICAVCAGCGSGAPSASETKTGTSGTAAGRAADVQAKGVKFAECMRGNGVADFPDPDPKGEFAYGVSVTPDVFSAAVEACKDLQPPGSLSSERTPEEQSASLEFAECVRENGVKDFPDPVDGEPLINTYEIPSSNEPGGMTVLNAATEECRDLLDAAAAGQ